MISVGLQTELVGRENGKTQFECQRMDEKFVLECCNDKCWFADQVSAKVENG